MTTTMGGADRVTRPGHPRARAEVSRFLTPTRPGFASAITVARH